MPDLVFSSARQTQGDPIYFVLDDVKYEFHPPKTAAIFLSAELTTAERARVQLNWLSAGLSEEDAAQLKNRLLDFEDDLLPVTLLEVVAALIEEASGRPTTPSPE